MTMLDSVLLTTSSMVVSQESPLLLVTMIGDPSRWSLSGSSATLSSSRMAPQSPPESRRGFHPSMGVGSGSRWASGRVP